ncbi:hypothetical protein [Nakamurella lactea]|uniref:hypothetical protein n=1 Tax=Nakamurella lactea TaxID=459515 RepID=UPI001378683E|nr:hypothetical protein [Nakamurella lactea]
MGPSPASAAPARQAAAPPASADPVVDEPSVARALTWWPPQRQVWTPVGWKGHLFRYDNFYTGAIVCQPAVALPTGAPSIKPYLRQYAGRDFQLTPIMPQRGQIPDLATEPYYLHRHDFGVGVQGWDMDRQTPVLWTDFRRQEGLVLRQEVFAHLPGGMAVQTADEPLYAWVRYRITEKDADSPAVFQFALRCTRAMYKHYIDPPEQQEAFVTMQVTPDAATMTDPLRIDRIWNPGGDPMTVPVFDDSSGDVRLMLGLPAGAGISLTELDSHPGVYDLTVKLPVEVGNTVDVLLPYLPQPRVEVDKVWQLGHDGALAETEGFWSARSSTSARISTPETLVNRYFHRSVQLSEVIAEKSPDTGLYTFLTGSYGYDLLWSTPTSMISHMFLDQLGEHEIVQTHLEPYFLFQGTRNPPGTAYQKVGKEGFFATPASLQSFDWLGDHGAILESVARHMLLSGDEAFIGRWTPAVVAAMDFIKRACAVTDHDGVAGLMPPAASNDTGVEQQSVWIQVWTYKGLRSGAEALAEQRHPRAKEFASLADKFRATFAAALRDSAASAPTWTDSNGHEYPIVPSKFSGPASGWPYLEAFDSGALAAVWAGLLPASDPLMTSFLEYFRSGPNTRLFDPWHHTALDRVVLDHEQSSGEPCYSWNLFHSWQSGDRKRFLEAMYGLMVGACSPDTFIAGEHRHGMYGTLFVQPMVTWAVKHAVVDDSLAANELHLLRLCPAAWLDSSAPLEMTRMATRYGPVSVKVTVSSDRGEVDVQLSASWRHKPSRIYLYRQPGHVRMRVNGRAIPPRDRILVTF